ncbi:hypothetical protein [Priestia megaterium]|uniref:hypothetical protein n=1 Tax=Priestia megaterium TaxID=1404 RepID=UPI0031017271
MVRSNSIRNLSEAKRWIDESINLIEENTIDSLLRYFQTGKTKKGVHLPSLLITEEHIIEHMLAEKLRPLIEELGFTLNEEELNEGNLVLDYTKGQFVLSFATINPYERMLKFNFDFSEMEREREVKLANLKRKVTETQQRYVDSKNFLSNNNGLKRIKYGKVFERIEETIGNISKEITVVEHEMMEIYNQKELLEDIKQTLPDIEYHFRKYGFLIEFVKGEDYEI